MQIYDYFWTFKREKIIPNGGLGSVLVLIALYLILSTD